MKAYQSEFLELALELEVLQFGEFKLKSGRISPYFFNAGRFDSGYAAARLSRCYAAAIADLDVEFDVLFGAAYKGIPLVVLAAAALAERYDIDYPFAFNRKEAKDHGEGGSFVGASVKDKRVLIVDDVITAGTAIKEVSSAIQAAGGKPVGVLVALDREEIGNRARIPARQQLETEIGLRIYNIVSLSDLVDHLETREEYAARLPAMKAYRNRYGVSLGP